MRKFYFLLEMVICLFFFFPKIAESQCATLTATCISYESRCAATGSINVTASGGSGSYKYKTTGPVNTNFTTSDSITGLSAGVYTVTVNDVGTNCNFTIHNVVVAGSYQDPRFTLAKIDVTCDNASNGSIRVDTYTFGRGPFAYTIIAPSPMGVGTTNTSGIFPNLIAGNYTIRMTDSCGGIQTRQITVINYTWWIDSYSFSKTGCDQASGFIKVVDSHGNISTAGGIPGFMYGIVRSAGDTIWSSNPNINFALLGHSTFQVVARDGCGIIKKGNAAVSLAATAAANVTTFNYLCNSFSASLTVGTNFLTPDFCLYDGNNALMSCNASGVFTGLAYGNYCIKAHDACTDTTITRCFNMTAPPINIGNTTAISEKVCASFTATVTGQIGLTNPEYCLYDLSNRLIICNNTGVFTGLSYQPYCITTHDGCRDTTITRCFTAQPPTPFVPAIINPYYVTCTNFGAHVGGDSLTLPEYCLYDTTGALIMCNSTGDFDSIPLGSYCINIHDSCYDTTFIRCIDVLGPVIHNDMMTPVSNKTCGTFTVTVSSHNLLNPEYCLYNDADVLIACNLTGEFNNVPYGSYCIKATVLCPDTTVVSCISVYPDLPAVGATVLMSNLNCTTFSAALQGVQHFNNPTYCLYDNDNMLINCNSTGSFNNLVFGTYCIKITDDCYDTTITRCFSQSPVKVNLSGSAGKSCSYGWAQFNLNAGGNASVLPLMIEIINPDGSLFSQASYNTNSILIDSIPGVLTGQRYKVVATDRCGNKDSVSFGSVASYFNHTARVAPKCPSATWANGSGNIIADVSTNMGSLTIRIIKKNGATLSPSIVPNTVIAGVYSFIDLGPGTYILSSSENSCNRKLYDTVVITTYQYPNLNRSSAYQCDVNGFSISAVASNGVGPFTYQIIGSQPTTPDITTTPQSSPVFSINNGANYSLIRLRALDACGNATLGDASILPLAINGTVSTFYCLSQPTTLSVDSLYNSSYKWYKKLEATSTDSILLGTETSYYIPTVLPSDTGIYVCYVTVNSGCITRSFTFHVDGNCWIVLPLKLEEFKGQAMDEKNLLTWKTSLEQSLGRFIIERKNNFDEFDVIGNVNAIGNSNIMLQYSCIDIAPLKGKNLYRLKMQKNDHSFSYSNLVMLSNSSAGNPFSVYPNPVTNKFTIDFGFKTKHHYNIQLLNSMNQVVKEFNFFNELNKLEIPRPKGMQKGIFILRIYDLDTKDTFKEKLVFL